MSIENKNLLKIKSLLRKKCPIAISLVGRFYAKYIGFRDVRSYLSKRNYDASAPDSLILFSTNRSATQFVESVLAKIYTQGIGVYIPLNKYLFFADRNADEHFLDANYMREMMETRGYFYGQQGPFSDLKPFQGFHKIAVIRDPRDLVVSTYHSIASAHVPRDQAFVDKIKHVRQLGLESFSREEKYIQPIENALRQAIILKEDESTLFWRYEDLMEDFDGFQNSCQEFINGKVDDNLSREILKMHLGSVNDGKQVEGRHRRSGEWGQFKKALTPETVSFLNEKFSPYLERLGYNI